MELLSFAGATDLAIAGVLIALLIFYSWWRGTGSLVLTAIAMPLAGFFFTLFPYHSELNSISPLGTLTDPLFFIFLLVLGVWVIRRTIGAGFGGTRPMHVIFTSFALTLLLITFSYHVVPIESVYDFGPLFDSIFGPEVHSFWISAIAMLALFVV